MLNVCHKIDGEIHLFILKIILKRKKFLCIYLSKHQKETNSKTILVLFAGGGIPSGAGGSLFLAEEGTFMAHNLLATNKLIYYVECVIPGYCFLVNNSYASLDMR